MPEESLPLIGLHHVALSVTRFRATRDFYVNVMQMKVEWEPDEDNVYLTSGRDNLAIHRAPGEPSESNQRLDHIGFIVPTEVDVDTWFQHVKEHHVKIVAAPKTHRDGARSFYCLDPEGTTVQIIYHPPLSDAR